LTPLSPTAEPPFQTGDLIPRFDVRSSNNPRFASIAMGGHYLVLCVFGTAADLRSKRILDGIVSARRSRFDDKFASFFGVSVDPEDESTPRMREQVPGIRWFWDFDGALTRRLGGGQGPVDPHEAARRGFTLVVDPFMRVLANVPFGEPDRHVEQVVRLLDGLPPPDRHAGGEIPAPVLVLPRVFEPDLCRTLIELYETHGGTPSGFMREREGKTVAVMDNNFKRRADFNFDRGDEFEPLRAAIRARIARRLLPAIHQVFQFNASRIERYIVACYDAASGGYFRAHRDNTTLGTAHRRFAVSINLNAEAFDGGDLRFPEFGERTYRPPTGGAVVFSCSLLHEATPVTAGRRFACLPFLYDDAAARVREKNRQFLSQEVIDANAERQGAAAGATV
jgi:predicted 2-oxoglutarate/Fe(II)-dependent dioxygenase YbiX